MVMEMVEEGEGWREDRRWVKGSGKVSGEEGGGWWVGMNII
jgi:hypothetical protein